MILEIESMFIFCPKFTNKKLEKNICGRSGNQIDSWLTVDLKNKEKLKNMKLIQNINIKQKNHFH
jgi:hypothetical protein